MLKTKRITKKQRAEKAHFMSLVSALLTDAGATLIEPINPAYDWLSERWELNTPIGLLDITPSTIGTGFTVFCRWDDAKKALDAGFPCNPYSGKDNHHYLSGESAETSAAAFGMWLGRAKAGRFHTA